MQDNIPDALITAFERQYDSSWNDPQLRNERLAMRYGWAAAMDAKQCLHQIQEPAPATAMDALREAEAALEVAMARILKADPGHSICVTSEAKALVAVRAALAATPAAAPLALALALALPEPAMNEEGYLPCPFCGSDQVSLSTGEMSGGQPWHYVECESCTATAEPEKWNERALLATGGQAQAVEQEPFGYFKAEPFGWTDCGPDDEGAVALYERPQAQADARDAGEFWGVLSPCGEGVFFRVEADARWTHTGHGSGSDGFGVPTIGEAFRECYEDEELELVRVHIAAIAAAKPHDEPAA